MKHDHDIDDLMVLARRGESTDARRLRDALASSAEARLLYEAGRAFDAEVGDDDGADAFARAVEKRIRPKRKHGAWALRLGIAAALIAGAAIGASELRSHPPPNVEIPVPPPPPPRVPDPAPPAAVVPPPPIETASAPPPSPPARVVPRPPAASASSSPPSLTAAELFAAANSARIAGDPVLAIRLSRQLEDQYPTSREAVTTHLSLGLLHLQQNAPADALVEFRRYRAVGTPATLPEALWGESRALRQLGRASEERTVLEELIDKYPSSAYVSAAQRRLSDLP